mmetsp:Transcript_24953/g.36632  ORF Transcript_24953/g.36632 Transcript_24953/m.36632 type:complete len:623 (+) Transcript_24953:68-1936(+)|eukprot:CAMPEP_0195509028 /NCGR_PEP_ID=MMETSP0794_2-20130614/2072_1 /TAXON_ID=515487 /ORGANISM="Stephanopyxis turris, Strain CCMP 815" /LENGTH=622 /DNA_ID=CAMNT_0040636139 /DNA_START=69 /DNA_END=1937 /DNA_ORIENTATION=+
MIVRSNLSVTMLVTAPATITLFLSGSQNGHAFMASTATRKFGVTISNTIRQPFQMTSAEEESPNGESSPPSPNGMKHDADDPTAFTVGVLGDLHIDPRKMEDYIDGREQWLEVLKPDKDGHGNVAMVSLGDLGESKNCDHNEVNPFELYAGTTLCHETAAEYLGSFGVPYEVIGGNHDLEGIDEFPTDEENLEVFLRSHNKPTPQFCREIAEKTLLVGLCSTVFRDATYTSHEVMVDDKQIEWFEQLLVDHPANKGWKIFVFTHAPPNGSGLRVLQENHVINGCCWLNHSDDKKCRNFIELVRKHRCIKGWFSGHFHLGQDYQDSITFPTIDPSEGPYPNRGSCVFAQTSVMRGGTSRDGRQQSRLLKGNKDGFEIFTVDHQRGGKIRLDATISYKDDTHEVGVYQHDDIAYEHDEYFKVYSPQVGDEGYICGAEQDEMCFIGDCDITKDSKCWWRLSCGRVLGVLNGMLLEYDGSTMAPLGLVVSADEMVGKKIAVIDSGIEECVLNFEDDGMDGADCADAGYTEREQAVIMYDEQGVVTVIQPNEDGSYWRKIVRNKIARMKEKRREKAAEDFLRDVLEVKEEDVKDRVFSSWGPYTSTSGVAKSTGLQSVTKKLKVYSS